MGTRERVEGLLKKHSEGLTVVEIARLSKISRNTAAVVLAGLLGEKKIWIRPVGVAKLHYWGKR